MQRKGSKFPLLFQKTGWKLNKTDKVWPCEKYTCPYHEPYHLLSVYVLMKSGFTHFHDQTCPV